MDLNDEEADKDGEGVCEWIYGGYSGDDEGDGEEWERRTTPYSGTGNFKEVTGERGDDREDGLSEGEA